MTSAADVEVEVTSRVATVQLTGTGAHNCLTDSLLTSLGTVLAELEADEAVWVVVIHGRDGALGSDPPPGEPEVVPPLVADGGPLAERIMKARLSSGFPDPFTVIRRFAKPLLCAMEGHVGGRALALALACDIRIAAISARMCCLEAQHGSIPLASTMALLSRIAGPARAADLVLTGRVLDAPTALEWGLVTRVVTDDAIRSECEGLARALASSAPLAMRFAKEAIVAGADVGLDAAVTLELDLSLILQLSRDRAEGLAAFRERRAPSYEGR